MHNQAMKAKKQIISILFLIGIMSVTMYLCLKDYSLHELMSAVNSSNCIYLVAGLCMMIFFVLCEAVSIQLILKVLGYPVSIRSCLLYSNVGFYFSSITPSASGGQPMQVYYMKQSKIPLSISTLVIFYIVFVYQIAMMLLGIAAFILRFDMSLQFIAKLKYLFIIGSVINTGAIFLFFALMFSKRIMPGLASFLVKAGHKLGLVKNVEEAILKADKSMQAYHEKAKLIKKHPVLFLQVLFLTILQLLAFSIIPFLVYKSLGLSADNLISLTACQALLTISVSAIPLPGAEGVTQVGFLQVFNLFFPKASIACAMLLHRIISFYIPLVISFLFYLLTLVKNRRIMNREVTVESHDSIVL
jgi:uncharacterized protein (TIRG00374 family)